MSSQYFEVKINTVYFFRVLVGNVAKEVHTMSEDSASHKWMVYVRSAPGSLSLDRHVSKVRFYLHPSYKPHDVITVT